MIALRRIGQIDPEAIRRAAARAWRKNSHGAGRMPEFVVAAMYADYQRTGSLRQTGERFGRSDSTMARIFSLRGLPLKTRGGRNHVLPDEVVRARFEAYQTAGSLTRAAALTGVSRGAILRMCQARGLPVNSRGGSKCRATSRNTVNQHNRPVSATIPHVGPENPKQTVNAEPSSISPARSEKGLVCAQFSARSAAGVFA